MRLSEWEQFKNSVQIPAGLTQSASLKRSSTCHRISIRFQRTLTLCLASWAIA